MDWATLGGDVVSAGLGYASQQQTNAANITAAEDMQQQQEQFSEYMSDTAVQRATADMKAAGINPILAAGQSAPMSGGSEAAPDITSPMEAVAGSAKQMASHVADVRNMQAETRQRDADVRQKDASTAVDRQQAMLVEQNTRKATAEAKVAESEAEFASSAKSGLQTFKPMLDTSSKGWGYIQKLIGMDPNKVDSSNVHMTPAASGAH